MTDTANGGVIAGDLARTNAADLWTQERVAPLPA